MFDDAPDYVTLELLSGMGFRRDRARLGWSRYLNDDGRRAAAFVAGRLNRHPVAPLTPASNF